MPKMPALVAMIVIVALAITSSAPLMVKAQNVNQGAPAGGAGEDMAHRTARSFAPIIRAIVTRRLNMVQQEFKIQRPVQTMLEQPDTIRILSRFLKPDQLDLNLVGGRTLGQNIGILLFTVATEQGPVSFKVYFYGFGADINISRIDINDDWDDIERLAATVDALPQPITVPISGQLGQ